MGGGQDGRQVCQREPGLDGVDPDCLFADPMGAGKGQQGNEVRSRLRLLRDGYGVFEVVGLGLGCEDESWGGVVGVVGV